MIHLFFLKIFAALSLLFLFFKEVLLSSVNLLKVIYTYSEKIESEFFELEVRCPHHFQQVIIAHFITLTPGTLSVDILKDRRILVHVLDRKNKKSTEALIHHKVEPLLKILWRKK